MEATEGVEPSRIIVAEVIPPRLEDAGLEDCALPLESIHEAFLRAATAVGSASSDDEDEDDDECGSGSEAPEESTGDPPPSTSGASSGAVVIERECAAEDCGSKKTAATKDVKERGASCALGLQKLEIR